MMPDFGLNQRAFLQPRTVIQSLKTLYLQDLLIQGSIFYHNSARVLTIWWSSSLQHPLFLFCVQASSSKNIFLEEVKTVIIYQWTIKYGYVSQACMLILHMAESNKTGHLLPWASGRNSRKLLIQYYVWCLRFQESTCSWLSSVSAPLNSQRDTSSLPIEKKWWQKETKQSIQNSKRYTRCLKLW